MGSQPSRAGARTAGASKKQERAMRTTVAEQTRDFARHFFTLIEELDSGAWQSAKDAFARTLEAHPGHPYAAYIRRDRVRRAGFASAAEQVRRAEFPQIERRKAGTRNNAPVYYRIRRPGTGPTLSMPYQVPLGHPLRVASGSGVHPLRTEPEDKEPRSTWRRRFNARQAGDAAKDDRSIVTWWHAITTRR
jgi:hypothetical protein